MNINNNVKYLDAYTTVVTFSIVNSDLPVVCCKCTKSQP